MKTLKEFAWLWFWVWIGLQLSGPVHGIRAYFDKRTARKRSVESRERMLNLYRAAERSYEN